MSFLFSKFRVKYLLTSLYFIGAVSLFYEDDDNEWDAVQGVIILNNQNFNKAIKSNKYILVKFYAPWCPHCQALTPEYGKAARMLEQQNSGIRLAKVDCTKETWLANQHNIRAYPTLYYYMNGTPMSYTGGTKRADDIVNWVLKRTNPPSET